MKFVFEHRNNCTDVFLGGTFLSYFFCTVCLKCEFNYMDNRNVLGE